eukprot:GEMP01025339.1.p1 GENE.GEMP01025339.1~~GEMP01025339.1.p1  ORF type:complete len:526 (+),score=128.59 GEMP01025339.1:114-1691(+)
MTTYRRHSASEGVIGTNTVPADSTPVQETTKQNEMGEKSKGHLMKRILGNPTVQILIGAVVGIGIGIGIGEGRAPPEVANWLGIPGALFIRGLKCMVVPLVFVQIALATLEMVSVGKAVAVGKKTILLYLLTTVLASVQGILWVLVFMNYFEEIPSGDTTLKEKATAKVKSDMTLSATFQQGIFFKLVPANFIQTFNATSDSSPNYLGVIVLAMVVAIAYGRMKKRQLPADTPDVFVPLLKQLNEIFMILLTWWIVITPIAVCSLIAGALGKRSNLLEGMSNLGYLIASAMCAWFTHVTIVYVGLYVICVRKNPWHYVRHLMPAFAVAVATASSAATLPVTMRCVKASKMVPSAIQDFVLSVGATINMDGSAIYFPAVITFLAISNGLRDQLGVVEFFLMALLSTLGSSGSAPIPSASLVLILTAYDTIFNKEAGAAQPNGFEYIFAIDWFMDRVRTTVNVTGDCVVTRCVAALETNAFRTEERDLLDETNDSEVMQEMSSQEVALSQGEPDLEVPSEHLGSIML